MTLYGLGLYASIRQPVPIQPATCQEGQGSEPAPCHASVPESVLQHQELLEATHKLSKALNKSDDFIQKASNKPRMTEEPHLTGGDPPPKASSNGLKNKEEMTQMLSGMAASFNMVLLPNADGSFASPSTGRAKPADSPTRG